MGNPIKQTSKLNMKTFALALLAATVLGKKAVVSQTVDLTGEYA